MWQPCYNRGLIGSIQHFMKLENEVEASVSVGQALVRFLNNSNAYLFWKRLGDSPSLFSYKTDSVWNIGKISINMRNSSFPVSLAWGVLPAGVLGGRYLQGSNDGYSSFSCCHRLGHLHGGRCWNRNHNGQRSSCRDRRDWFSGAGFLSIHHVVFFSRGWRRMRRLLVNSCHCLCNGG